MQIHYGRVGVGHLPWGGGGVEFYDVFPCFARWFFVLFISRFYDAPLRHSARFYRVFTGFCVGGDPGSVFNDSIEFYDVPRTMEHRVFFDVVFARV